MSSQANQGGAGLLSPRAKSNIFSHKGYSAPDPFSPRQGATLAFFNALSATALFRCWHHLVFFGAWATLITILNYQGHKLHIETTLLTVLGTVLGFVVSYRTTSAFERYNEGRKLWSQIIVATRHFARLVWFHVPDPVGHTREETEELKARSLIEKKTVINLLEAYAVAVKHYLRGEDGIYYQDLYYLIRFLPPYALPAGFPSQVDIHNSELNQPTTSSPRTSTDDPEKGLAKPPLFQTTEGSALHQRPVRDEAKAGRRVTIPQSFKPPHSYASFAKTGESGFLPAVEEAYLFPSSMPPKSSIFDLFPFSLLIKFFSNKGHEVKGKKAARIRAKMRSRTISQNLPLEISFYLSSYLASVERRKLDGGATIVTLHMELNLLVDCLTDLERILTTPVPFSYSIHLWLTTIIYCLGLPFQLWKPLGWVTIPGTVIFCFMFFGFLVAGEEIENPFGYDKNDLNLDHFTSNIIHNELKAITSTPPPDPEQWAFAPENNLLFSSNLQERTSPDEWVAKGHVAISANLASRY